MPDIQDIRTQHEPILIQKKGVVGVGIGTKWINNTPSTIPAILVFVERKLPPSDIIQKYSVTDLIPDNLEGIPTDVIEVGKIVKQDNFLQRIRPVKPGYSIGQHDTTAGTIGGFFLDRDNDPVILSNNHILACFDPETEVLTKEGFKFWDQVRADDQLATLNPETRELEYQLPSMLHRYWYQGTLYRLTSKHLDQCVTHNHRLYCRKDYKNATKKSNYEFITAENAVVSGNSTIRFLRTAKWHCETAEEVAAQIDLTTNPNLMEEWVEFLGYYLAEGSTTYSPQYFDKKTGRRKHGELYITSIRNKDHDFLRRCKDLLDKLGFKSFINHKSFYCRSYNRLLYNYLERFGKAAVKHIPTEIKQLSSKYLKILLEALSRGDGCKVGENHIFTLKSKRLIDDIQELAIKLGGCATVRPKKGSGYWHCEVFWTNLEPKVRNIESIQYTGMVYCATVPNEILLVRRNGKLCWSGNCENRAKIGDPIYQPGPYDSTGDLNFRGWLDPVINLPYIATLKQFVTLAANNNLQDSAIAAIHPKILAAGLIDPSYPTINQPCTGFGPLAVGMKLQKCGRTTGYTTGQVIALNASFTIDYDFGPARFLDCAVLSAMSQGGDSGALILDMNQRAVALLFAGSDQVTLANPINPIVEHYGLRIWNLQNNTGTVTSTFGNRLWQTVSTDGQLTNDGQLVTITAAASQFCYLEAIIPDFESVSVIVNTGTDKGTLWGPGLTVQWPNGALKVNIMGDRFGGCFNGPSNLNIGAVKPNTDYTLQIRKSTVNTYIGEIQDENRWYTVIELPTSVFPHPPVSVRIGKNDMAGQPTSATPAGASGVCTFRNFQQT